MLVAQHLSIINAVKCDPEWCKQYRNRFSFQCQQCSLLDTCIYGDYKGPMRYSDNTQTDGVLKIFCTDVATTQHSRCYEANVASECCKTCGTIQASPSGEIISRSNQIFDIRISAHRYFTILPEKTLTCYSR